MGALAGAGLAAGCSAHRGNWDFLSTDEARTLGALCDQIIPGDDFPSASQAGVLTYIDRQLTRAYRRYRGAYRASLRDTEKLSRERFGVGLADARAEQQLDVARALEQQKSPFFELVRNHTMEGYYGSPRHGGNRDAVSWRMLGLQEPPVRGRSRYDLTAAARPWSSRS